MNWTGGSLQRTKKANAGVLQQQKAYFAKARTQLQNATDSHVAPLRPNHLIDNDKFDIWNLVPLGSGSVRWPTGHTAKRPSERTQREPTPDKRRLTRTSYERHSKNLLRRSPSNSNAKVRIHRGISDLHDGKHRAPEMDMDLQWLEANRKRLLTQQDWVGIDLAKPVSLRFQSSREKSRIGKRRRTKKGRSAAPRQRDNEEFRDKDLELANDNFSRMLRGSGPHQNVDNMRIRIGTDAMTSIYSTQLNQHAQSHASSELMLFDQEGPLAQQRSEKPLVNLQLHAATSASEQARVNSHAPSTGEQPQCYSIARRNVASLSSGASEQGGIIGDQLGLQCQPTTITSRQTGSFTHEFRLTHHLHNGERAFRLAFSGSNSAAGSRSRTASDDYQIGETQPFCNPDSALPSKTEHMHQVDIDMEHPVNVEISAGHAIVDEGPWKTYLAISDDSSHSDTARSSFLHDHPTTKQDNEAATNWSQQATHGQGDQSRVSSSSISASLPSLTRRIREPILTHPSGVTAIRRKEPVTTALRSLDEDEKNWRAFVFQSDDNLSLPGMQDHACKTSPLISRSSENASSEYLSISRAVSSVSPIVYESGSELASDAGYDAPDPRSFAPPLRSRNASPLLFGGFVERLTQGEQGDEMLERKVSDKQWVTHASLQNNASSGLTSSKVLVT